LVVEFVAVVGSGPRGRTQQIQIKGDNTREVSREQHSYKSQPRYFFTTDSVSTIKSEPKSYWKATVVAETVAQNNETVAVL
jgi:hypothetical protein